MKSNQLLKQYDLYGATPFVNKRTQSHAMVWTLLVGIEIALSTGFNYVWIGSIPAWTLWLFPMGAALLVSSSMRRDLDFLLRQPYTKAIILGWVFFQIVVIVTDSGHGYLYRSFAPVIVYNLLALITMFLVALGAMRTSLRWLIWIMAVFTAIGGILGVLQFLDVAWAWRFPDLIATHFSSMSASEIRILNQESGGRVRGTHTLIHKFSAYQGILLAWLVSIAAGYRRVTSRNRVGFIIFLLLVILGGLSLPMTFTRSAIFGVGMVMVLISVFSSGRFRAWIIIGVGFALLLTSLLDYRESGSYARLFNLSARTHSISARIYGYQYAWDVFRRSPFLGEGTETGLEYLVKAIHSVPLRILANYGIFALLGYIIVILAFAGAFILTYRIGSYEAKTVAFASIAGLLVGVIDSATHSSGLLRYDIAEPALFGMFLGQCYRVRKKLADR